MNITAGLSQRWICLETMCLRHDVLVDDEFQIELITQINSTRSIGCYVKSSRVRLSDTKWINSSIKSKYPPSVVEIRTGIFRARQLVFPGKARENKSESTNFSNQHFPVTSSVRTVSLKHPSMVNRLDLHRIQNRNENKSLLLGNPI